MEKQVLIRGVAILCAGVGVSVFAAPHIFLDKPQMDNAIDLATLQSSTASVRTAGLSGSAPVLQFNAPPQGDGLTAELVAQPQTPEGADEAEQMPDLILNAARSDDVTVPVAPEVPFELDLGPQLAFASEDISRMPDHCTPRIEAVAGPDALIELSVTAPCHSDTRFVASHDDLAFSAFLGPEGQFSTYIPALATAGRVDVFLSDDTHLHATIEVPDALDYKRVVLQWTGAARFALHAYHDGAAYGANGHVHAARPFDPDLDEAFLISLGDLRGPEPMLAQIYSLPLDQMEKARVEVELAFSETECGREAMAFLSQTQGATGKPVAELTFSAPDCPASAGSMVMGLDLIAAAPEQPQQTSQAVLSRWQD